MAFGDVLHQRQSDATSAKGCSIPSDPSLARFSPHKTLKNALALALGNPGAIVRNAHLDAGPFGANCHTNGGRTTTCGLAILDGIVDEVHEGQLQRSFVESHVRKLAFHLDDDRRVLSLGAVSEHLSRTGGDARNILAG